MDFLSQVIPATVVLAANLLSGPHSSLRWEYVTAVFGWSACIGLVGFLIAHIAFPSSSVDTYLFQLFFVLPAYCTIQRLRTYIEAAVQMESLDSRDGLPNKALQPTAQLLRSRSAAELKR